MELRIRRLDKLNIVIEEKRANGKGWKMLGYYTTPIGLAVPLVIINMEKDSSEAQWN